MDNAHCEYQSNELLELSKGVRCLSPFPDPRVRGEIMALVVLVSEQVCAGNNVL